MYAKEFRHILGLGKSGEGLLTGVRWNHIRDNV